MCGSIPTDCCSSVAVGWCDRLGKDESWLGVLCCLQLLGGGRLTDGSRPHLPD